MKMMSAPVAEIGGFFPSSSNGDDGEAIRQLLKGTLYITMGLDFDVMVERLCSRRTAVLLCQPW